MKKQYRSLTVLLLAVMFLCAGCKSAEERRMVVTWGLGSEELFRIDKESMTVPEAKILLMTQMADYRNVYGEAVLMRNYGQQTFAETIKENTLSLLGKIMVMNRMAEKYQIYLTQEDLDKTKAAAQEFFVSLTDVEKDITGADVKDIQRLFERIRLADKVFEELTGEQDIEISDDEARVVVLRHIMIRTTKTDEQGILYPLSGTEKQEAYTKSLEIFDKLQQGADFDSLAELYNEDVRTEYAVGRGDLTESLEQTVFDMETGETSIVLESAAGYHIIRCENNFDREATESNKSRLVSQRKWSVFEETYNAFAAELDCEFNEKRWKSIELAGQDAVNSNFLEMYRSYFADEVM